MKLTGLMTLEAEPPKVLVVVVGKDSLGWLSACLKTLVDSTYKSLKIMFVDNASDDQSSEYVSSEFPSVIVVKNVKNLGFAQANNIGLKWAVANDYDYVALINPDTQTPATLLSTMVDFMEENTDLGIAGPMQGTYSSFASDRIIPNDWSNTALKNGVRHALHHWDDNLPDIETEENQQKRENTLHHAYVQGAALFVRVEVIKKIGMLNRIFHSFYEETEWCRRARYAGYKVALVTNLWIHHAGGSDAPPSMYRQYYMMRNKYIFLLTYTDLKTLKISSIYIRWLRFDARKCFKDNTFKTLGLRHILISQIGILMRMPEILKMRKVNRFLSYDEL